MLAASSPDPVQPPAVSYAVDNHLDVGTRGNGLGGLVGHQVLEKNRSLVTEYVVEAAPVQPGSTERWISHRRDAGPSLPYRGARTQNSWPSGSASTTQSTSP